MSRGGKGNLIRWLTVRGLRLVILLPSQRHRLGEHLGREGARGAGIGAWRRAHHADPPLRPTGQAEVKPQCV